MARARNWVKFPLDGKLSQNTDEVAVGAGVAELENGYVNEQGGNSRFPKLKVFALLDDDGRVYLNEWRGDLVAATGRGRFYRLTRNGTVEDRTGAVVAGDSRVIFAASEDELAMAAGGQIIRFAGDRTEVLSKDAPLSTHVAFIDSYLVALERGSGRFFHSNAGLGRKWDALDVFAANGQPDDITALMVTPFNELLNCGPKSVEQFERLSGGTLPFFRRWTVGIGVFHPYMLLFADNAVFTVNELKEFTRFSGQQSSSVGDDIGAVIMGIDDWTDAWMGGFPDKPLHIAGQKFIIMQWPRAVTPYGTKGMTFAYDYRLKRFARLYGWDADKGVPTRWPGWSHWSIWGRHFVGGAGVVYELVPAGT